MLTVNSINKTFGYINAVQNISFTAEPQKIFGILGPNGAGKTTIIRIIMNILNADSGTVYFQGKKFQEKDKENIGYLPEERGLYPKLTIEEMLTYLGRLKGMNQQQCNEQIDHWLKRFGLSEWKKQKIYTISKGMSQKVQFIASIIHSPQLIILDGPFSGLGPVSSDTLLTTIMELRKNGSTILFSTHIMEHAEKICHHILLLNKGHQVVQGSLTDIKKEFSQKPVTIEYDGSLDFLKKLTFIENIIEYPRWAEIQLASNTSPDDLLKACIGNISIKRSEITGPSLHNIFIQLVGKHE